MAASYFVEDINFDISEQLWPHQKKKENFDCLSFRNHSYTQLSALAMKWNGQWWGDSSSWDMGSVEYPFIAITPRFSLAWSGSTC